MTERAPFSSVGPNCGQGRVMTGLTNEELD